MTTLTHEHDDEEGVTCADCRFGEALPPKKHTPPRARCFWVNRAQDEAGDRMPRWAWSLVRAHPDAEGNAERGADCPAFEVRA